MSLASYAKLLRPALNVQPVVSIACARAYATGSSGSGRSNTKSRFGNGE